MQTTNRDRERSRHHCTNRGDKIRTNAGAIRTVVRVEMSSTRGLVWITLGSDNFKFENFDAGEATREDGSPLFELREDASGSLCPVCGLAALVDHRHSLATCDECGRLMPADQVTTGVAPGGSETTQCVERESCRSRSRSRNAT